LYGTSAERVDVLNRSAGTFFNVLQIVLLHDVQLSLSKLGDPAQSRVQKNMTLKALAAQLQTDGESAVVLKLVPRVGAFDVSCSKIRHRRNKWIAHFDRDTMLNATVAPLEGPSRAEIEEALAALREVLNCIEKHYTETTTGYEYFTMTHDGDALVAALIKSLRYEELVREGVIAPDDLIGELRRRGKT
jgi:hypothetical protein